MFSDIYVTAPTFEEAKRIANTIIDEKLGACVNLHPITSVYKWRGNVEDGEEYALSIKTRTGLVEQVISKVRELHSYENPCIICFKIQSGSAAYLDWVRDETL